MYNVNATKKLAELELNEGLEGNRSWHHQFKDSAYIYVGGLHQGLTEGDVVIMFSQFGEIVDINLARDKQTGKSKGFAFVCFEDQRSTVLSVDNMNGFSLLKRTLRVDHVGKYKAPKEFDENDKDVDGDPKLLEYKATGAEGAGPQVFNVIQGQKKIDELAQGRKVQVTKAETVDEDEAWARAFETSIKQNSKGGTHKGRTSSKKSKKDVKEMKQEIKRLKKEAKKAKDEAKNLKKVTRQGRSTKAEPSSSSSDSSSESEDSNDSRARTLKKLKTEAP